MNHKALSHLLLILNYFLLVLMSWGQQLWKNTWQIHYSPTTSKEISNSILRYFKKETKKKIGKYSTISNTHKKGSHSWLAKSGAFFFWSAIIIYLFCYCCPRLIWFTRMRKCGNFSSSEQHNIHHCCCCVIFLLFSNEGLL